MMRTRPRRRFTVLSLLLLVPLCLTSSGARGAPGHEDEDSSPVFTGALIFPIYVSDVQASATFYRDVLGFEFLGFYDYEANGYVRSWQGAEPPRYAGFVAGDQKFGLHKPANEAQERCVGCGRYYFRVKDLDAQHARVSLHEVEVSPIHSSALLRRFYVPDPDGVMIFFAETADGAPLDPW